MHVICWGDSNTYGWDPRSFFGSRYPAECRWVDILAAKTGWTVINEGQNGREIPRQPVTVAEDTDLLIVMLGTNDLLRGSTAGAAAERMKRFLSGLSIDRHKLLLIAPPPLTLGEWVPDGALVENSRAYAAACRDIAGALGISFSDAGDWGVSLTYDGVHFTEAGHRAFAEGLFKELTT